MTSQPLAAEPSTLDTERPEAAALTTDWISWLRFVAIVGVVAIHTAGATAVLTDARDTAQGILAIVINRGFNFAVPLFVLLSGALLLDPARYPGDGPFLRKRALRLVPAVIFWHLFYVAFRVLVLDNDLTARDALVLTLNGRLYTALYFFWIVLGLAVVTPVLIAWVGRASRRGTFIAAGVAVGMTALTAATVDLRGAPLQWVETPWTWWIPYVGVYLLGWAVRGVRLPAWATALTLLVAVGILGAVVYNFGRVGTPGWFGDWFGGYYSLAIQVCAACVALAAQQLLQPAGPLRVLVVGRLKRWGRTLGDATLGIFGVHLAVLYASYNLPLIGGDAPAQTVQELIGRIVFVVVVSVAIALVCRRIPVVRRVF